MDLEKHELEMIVFLCQQEKQTLMCNQSSDKANELIRNRIMIVDKIKDKFTKLLVDDLNANANG